MGIKRTVSYGNLTETRFTKILDNNDRSMYFYKKNTEKCISTQTGRLDWENVFTNIS